MRRTSVTIVLRLSCSVALVIGAVQAVSAIQHPQQSADGVEAHRYVTWDRFEVDRCVAAWLIKRHLDPEATFEFLPVGTSVPQTGCITFDAPNARYERAPGKAVSELILSETKLRDSSINRLMKLVRATEVAFWMLKPDSDEARLRDSLRRLWIEDRQPDERLQPIFAYLDAVYASGGAVPVDQVPTPLSQAQHDGIHNVLRVFADVLSGSQPQGDEGFDSLAKLGVRTVISVDGAKPDIARSRARGMRYVHIPVGYDGIKRDRQLQLAKAVRDLPRPIYSHCHHGKHRGPAAAAVAGIGLGKMDRKAAKRFMKQAGTSEQYSGLWACAENMSAIDPQVLDALPAEFPEIVRVSGTAEIMVQIDRAFDHLQSVRAAGWQIPEDHPDLVPMAEAAALADLLRHLADDPAERSKPLEFGKLLSAATKQAKALEQAITENAPTKSEIEIVAIHATCKKCHATFRN